MTMSWQQQNLRNPECPDSESADRGTRLDAANTASVLKSREERPDSRPRTRGRTKSSNAWKVATMYNGGQFY